MNRDWASGHEAGGGVTDVCWMAGSRAGVEAADNGCFHRCQVGSGEEPAAGAPTPRSRAAQKGDLAETGR
jgi:hypothetical protein